MGVFALIIGGILILCAIGTNTAPEGTHNLGLLQQQMMLLQTGLALLIVSAVRWDKGASVTKSRIVSAPLSGESEPVERDHYEKPTGFDTQQKVIAGVLFVAVMAIIFIALHG